MAIKLMLPNVRCAFLVLGEPEQYQGKGAFRWAAVGLVPAGSPLKAEVDVALVKAAEEKWDKKAAGYLKAILTDPKGCCWQDGARKENYDGFAGNFALSAYRYQDKGRPLVMDRDKSPIYKPDNTVYDGKGGIIYAGCFVNMQVEIWAQDNGNGRGLRATLLGIQKARDGDAFGGGAAPNAEDFGEVTEGADAGDLG